MPLIDADTVSFSKRLASITQLESGQYFLAFDDGTTHNADLIIGADGIRSTVRNAVVDAADPNKDRLVFANRYVYRGVISVEALKAVGVTQDVSSQPLVWLGFGKVGAQKIFFSLQTKVLTDSFYVADGNVSYQRSDHGMSNTLACAY